MNKTHLKPDIKAKPFLRWTGSKKWLVKSSFQNYIPKDYNQYHECFLGGGSVFFHLNPLKPSYLFDSNQRLIETYVQIRDNLDNVINKLKTFRNTEDEYYRIRKLNLLRPHTRAAQFIYLNKCSFNGIYRVNNRGVYNVPYGKRTNVDIVTPKILRSASEALKLANLSSSDFEVSLENISAGDLIFLDPPYTVAHENNGFIEYNQKLFSWEDQIRLKHFIDKIIEKEAYFILTNASHDSIKELYKDCGEFFLHSRNSQVGGRNKTRGMYNEFVICNTI